MLVFTLIYQKKSVFKGNETEIQGIVYKKKITDDKVTLYLKSKEKIIVNYYTIHNNVCFYTTIY